MAAVVARIVILHQGLADSDDPMKANAVKVRDNLEFNIRELDMNHDRSILTTNSIG